MIQKISEIKKHQKKPDGIFGSFLTRPVSHIFAWIALKIGMSPNVVSLLSFLFCVAAIPILILYPDKYYMLVVGAGMWWIGGILDAADGDLARYSGQGSSFGGWFDSFLDRLKEFLIFAVIGYITFKKFSNELYLFLGFISVFTNVMSGYISDTRKLFIRERTPEISFSKKYSFGMVDTRDFIIILSLLVNEMRIVLWIYGTIFLLILLLQLIKFIKDFHKSVL